jgi:fatty acid-binding protein DegV
VDGKMDVGKKYRGSFDKIIIQYVEDKLSGRSDIDLKRIFITYPPATKPAIIKNVIEKVKSLKDFNEIICCEAGCVISNQCGPICLGILFYRQ